MSDDLTIEKLRINERLQALETSVALLIQEFHGSTQKTDELLKRHDDILMGDTSLQKPGLVVRTVRLEEAHESNKWLWGSLIALAGDHLRHLFFGGH